MAHPLIHTVRRFWSEKKQLRCPSCNKLALVAFMQKRPDRGTRTKEICCDRCAANIRLAWGYENPRLPLEDLPEDFVQVRPARKPPDKKRRRSSAK